MNAIEEFVHFFYLGLSLVGVLAVVVGVAGAVVRYVWLRLLVADDERFGEEAPRIRVRLGEHLVIGLDVFIAADIVNSVIGPNWEKVGLLAAIVAVRVVLSYILLREIDAARSESEHLRRDK